MSKPTRAVNVPVFGSNKILISVFQGLSVFAIIGAVYGIALLLGKPEAETRTLTFATLVVANIGLILTNRSWSTTIFETLKIRNNALSCVAGGAIFFLGLVLYVPFLQNLFHFSTLHLNDVILCFAAGLFSILWFEFFKLFSKNRTK